MKTEPGIDALLDREEELRRAAYRAVGNSHDVDDVLQDVWLAVLERPPAGVRSQRAWLLGLLRKLSVDRFRSESARRRRERVCARGESALALTDEELDAAVLRRRMLQQVLELEEPFRETLLLRYVAGMEPVEIGAYLGVPAATVRGRCRRGLERLRRRLGVDDERRRRAVLAVLVPGMVTRGRRLAAAAVAGVVLSALATWAWLDEDDAPVDALEPPEPHAVAAPAAPRRTPEPRGQPAAFSAPPAVAVGRVAVTGCLRLMLEGRPFAGTLDIRAEPVATGAASWLLPLEAVDDDDWSCPSPVAATSAMAGEEFTLPVAEAGQYRLFIRCEGVRGGFLLYHPTGVPLDHTIALLPRLGLTLPSGSGPATRPCVRAPSGDGFLDIEAQALGDRSWAVEGPLFPGVRVGSTRPGQSLDETWWQQAFDREVRLATPRVSGFARVELRDLETKEPLAHAAIDLMTWSADSRRHVRRVVADAAGSCRIPIPALRDAALGTTLAISAPGRSRRTLRDYPELLAPRDPDDVLLVEVGPDLDGGGRLVGGGGGPLSGLAVVVLGEEALAGGTTGDAGRFVLHGRPRASSARRISDDRLLLDEPPARVTVVAVREDGEARTFPGVELADLLEGRWVGAWTDGREGAPWAAPPSAPGGAVRPVRIVDEEGRGLGLVRLSTAHPDEETVFRTTTDHAGGALLEGLVAGRRYALSVLAPGREPSLVHPPSVTPGGDELVIRTVPLVPIPLTARRHAEDDGFLAVILEDEARTGRRRALFGRAARESIPLTLEPQRVTSYRPGHRACETRWEPGDGSEPNVLAVHHEPGARVFGRAPAGTDTVRAVPRSVAVSPRHDEPLRDWLGEFAAECAVDGSGLALVLTPGRYRLLALAGGVVVAEAEVDVDVDGDLELRPEAFGPPAETHGDASPTPR